MPASNLLPDSTPPDGPFDHILSRAIDRTRIQIEAAEQAGDEEIVAIFARQLEMLEALIPEAIADVRRQGTFQGAFLVSFAVGGYGNVFKVGPLIEGKYVLLRDDRVAILQVGD